MNKQEAIETIKNIDTLNVNDNITGQKVDMVIKSQVLEIISQIHEPQKPVVPKFVADWYEIYKNDLDHAIYNTITGTYRKVNGENNDLLGTFETWLVYEDNSILTLVKMYLFGYEVEKEKLYTVEIPNPNLNTHTILQKIGKGLALIMVTNARWKGWESSKLTETEIKQDFDWALQWAKEVE